MKTTLHSQLRKWRKRSGLTLEAAARTFSVTVSAYTKWERGERLPEDANAVRVARVLDRAKGKR